MLLGWMAEDIQEQAGVDAVAGDGTTKIKGLFAETANYTTKLSGSAGAIVNTNFLTMYFALPIKYRRNAKWVDERRHPLDRRRLRLPEPQQHAARAS